MADPLLPAGPAAKVCEPPGGQPGSPRCQGAGPSPERRLSMCLPPVSNRRMWEFPSTFGTLCCHLWAQSTPGGWGHVRHVPELRVTQSLQVPGLGAPIREEGWQSHWGVGALSPSQEPPPLVTARCRCRPFWSSGPPPRHHLPFLAPRLSFPCLKLACRLAARSSPSSSGELPQYRTL